MRYLVAVLLLSSVVLAKDKLKPSDYQSGTLVSFRTETRGASCSGSASGKVDNSGNVNASTDSNCVNSRVRVYTIKVGDQTLSIEHAYTGKQKAAALGTLGMSGWFEKGSVLRDQLPGAHIEVRSDESGLYVRVGGKESKFRIVGAE